MHNLEKTTINPYLTFNGNCKEAMDFYKNALDGKLEIIPFKDSPMEVPEDFKSKTMHATLTFGDAVIMASDNMPGQTSKQGDSMAISIAENHIESAEKFFNNLSDGAAIIISFEETFWGAKFGMLIDKFGFRWMVNCQLEK